jgi:2-polyprenyl-6-methoxyphenol hydroxylase-like FAD-dependent oxidoreductase
MRIAIIGSGPVGMTAALLLARQGHQVLLADRDPGPVRGRTWDRVGVMQFHLPHGFRSQCRNVLLRLLPDVHAAMVSAGATVVAPQGAPAEAAMLQVRRSVFEQVLWESTSAEPGVVRLTGHVSGVEVEDGRGIVIDSAFVPADLVVDASGRAGRLSAPYRPLGQRVDCGMAYAARQYRLLPGAEPGPINGGPGFVAHHRGFLVMVFQHEIGTFTVLFVRPSADKALALLRDTEAFEAACRVVPGLAEWTDPERSEPIDAVRAGAGLTNEYRQQPIGADGLVAIGDAFGVTNPQGARGVSLGMQSAAVLAELLSAGTPLASLAAGLDAWGRAQLLPWYEDHVDWDASLLSRWAGQPVDADGPIGIEVLVEAAQERHPEWMAILLPFFGMAVMPAALEPIREEVRAMIREGWQPQEPEGPSRDELAALVHATLAERVPVPA